VFEKSTSRFANRRPLRLPFDGGAESHRAQSAWLAATRGGVATLTPWRSPDDRILAEVFQGSLGLIRRSVVGVVYAPSRIQARLHPEDVPRLYRALGGSDLSERVRLELERRSAEVVVPSDFTVLLETPGGVRRGHPKCHSDEMMSGVEPFLAAMVQGATMIDQPWLPIRGRTALGQEELAKMSPRDTTISRHHADISVIGPDEVLVRPMHLRRLELEGTALTGDTILRYRAEGYRLTFGQQNFLLFWADRSWSIMDGHS